MAHYGTLQGVSITQIGDDIRGANVYGINDEKLGKIDDVIFDHSSGDIGYAVVDTGGWLHSHKFIVPTDGLRASTRHKEEFETNLTKQQVENLPPYDEKDLQSESKWSGYEGRYRSKWIADPVMHRAETDRNITPTTYQTTGNLDSERAAAAQGHGEAPSPRIGPSSANRRDEFARADLEAASSPTERVMAAGSDSVVISNSASGIGGRWDTFQSHLRERRKEAVAQCRTCAGETTQHWEDDAGTLRKAV